MGEARLRDASKFKLRLLEIWIRDYSSRPFLFSPTHSLLDHWFDDTLLDGPKTIIIFKAYYVDVVFVLYYY